MNNSIVCVVVVAVAFAVAVVVKQLDQFVRKQFPV